MSGARLPLSEFHTVKSIFFAGLVRNWKVTKLDRGFRAISGGKRLGIELQGSLYMLRSNLKQVSRRRGCIP